MANEIVDKYFEQENFSDREKEAIEEVSKKTGFEIEKEIYRGSIFGLNKVGSLIYRGKWQDNEAVLKIQGLKPSLDEPKIIQNFNAQNKSKIIRVPELFDYSLWKEERGYGYLITEYVNAPKIFQMPFANDEQMNDFARFYQEYRAKAVTKPWEEEPKNFDLKEAFQKQVYHWQKIAEDKKILKKEDYLERFNIFNELIDAIKPMPIEFSHGHTGADDIFKENEDKYIIMSNLFWGYKPQWHDLSFNIWACLHTIRSNEYSFENLLEYVNKWLFKYKQIPVVQNDPDFDYKIVILLLNKTLGSILVELGTLFEYEGGKNKIYFDHLLELHKQFFDYLAERLKEFK